MNPAQIANVVDNVLRRFQTAPIYIKKFSGLSAPAKTTNIYGRPDVTNPYGYQNSLFDAPVQTVGRGILKPTKEMFDGITTDKIFDAAFLWSRLELARKFPTLEENAWITEKDRLVFRNNEYSIVEIHPTGAISDQNVIFVALAQTQKGQTVGAP